MSLLLLVLRWAVGWWFANPIAWTRLVAQSADQSVFECVCRVGPVHKARFESWEMYSAGRVVRADVEFLDRQVNALNVQLRDSQKSAASVAAVAPLFRVTQFPLEDALAAIESISVPGVELKLIDVNLLDGTAKAAVESPSAEAMSMYLRRLDEVARPGHWRLEKLQELTGVPLPTGSPGLLPNSVLPSVDVSRASTISAGSLSAVLSWDKDSP